MSDNRLSPEEYAAWRVALLRLVAGSCVCLSWAISVLWGFGVLGPRFWGLLPASLACFFAAWLAAYLEIRRSMLAPSGNEPPAPGFSREARLALYGFILGVAVFVVFLSANYGRWGQG